MSLNILVASLLSTREGCAPKEPGVDNSLARSRRETYAERNSSAISTTCSTPYPYIQSRNHYAISTSTIKRHLVLAMGHPQVLRTGRYTRKARRRKQWPDQWLHFPLGKTLDEATSQVNYATAGTICQIFAYFFESTLHRSTQSHEACRAQL